MFLSLNALSVNANTNLVVLPQRTYSGFTFKGNGTIDAAHLRNIELTDVEILNISTVELFGANSIFLANFENTLQAGNYVTLSKPIASWKIARRKTTEFSPAIIATLDKTITTYTDFTQANNVSYEYQFSPIADDGTEGTPILSIAESNFFGWFLCSTDSTKVYKFDMEITSDAIMLNMDQKVFEGFSQFPTVRTGVRKYHSGGLKTMPYQYNGNNISVDYTLLTSIQDFISDGTTKVLKNTKGDLFYVQTSQFQYQYRDTIGEQPMDISFKFTEVAGV
jgi:hypothetical protein